jgi:hypothetical protein
LLTKSAGGGELKRISLRPESWLPWLTILGFGAFVVSWFGRRTFYAAFGVSPEMVGADYPSLLIPTAVYAVFLMLLLVVAFAFMVPPVIFTATSRRVVRWQLRVGGWILFLGLAVAEILQRVVGEGADAVVAAVMMPTLFGGVLFSYGLVAWFDRFARRAGVRGRIWLLQRKATSPEDAREAAVGRLHTQYRRRRARRRERARIRTKALQATAGLLLGLVALLYITLAVYLGAAAATAARNAIEGRSDLFPGTNLPASVLLNVHVRPVRIDAIAPQFRPLQKAEVLYLGTNAGAYVFYDRTARQAVLVPSGSVALRFESHAA